MILKLKATKFIHYGEIALNFQNESTAYKKIVVKEFVDMIKDASQGGTDVLFLDESGVGYENPEDIIN